MLPLKWGKDPKEDTNKRSEKRTKLKDPKEDKWEINRKSQWGHKNRKIEKKEEKRNKKREGGNTTNPFKRYTLVLQRNICTS